VRGIGLRFLISTGEPFPRTLARQLGALPAHNGQRYHGEPGGSIVPALHSD
jgi:hypothetical protein